MKPTTRSFASSLAFLSLILGSLCAGDAVQVVATSPAANEQNLVPGQVLFTRTGSGTSLTVNYRISGSAHPTNPAGNNQDGSVAAVNIITSGSGYLSSTTNLAFSGVASPAFNPAATANSIGGRVTAINVISGGTNYTSIPSVTIIGDGSGATGSAVLSGYVSQINVSGGGTGYTGTPSVSISGSGGATATATVDLISGTVTSVNITNGGNDYTIAPNITFTGGGATVLATATAAIAFKVGSVNVTSSGQGYTFASVAFGSNAGGSGATGAVTLTGSPVNSTTLSNTGYGYQMPTVQIGTGQAFLATNMTGNNNDVLLSAIALGDSGNAISLTLVDPGSANQTLLPTISGKTISISLATDNAGAISTTATQLISLINATPSIAALVTASLKIGNDGTGIVTALTKTYLVTAIVRPVINNGALSHLAIENAGSGYTSAPTVTIAPPTAGATAIATATIDSLGRVNGFTITNAGSGYGPTATANDTATIAETQATFGIVLAGPDYVAPAGSSIDATTGDLIGTFTFSANQTAFALDITPRRNGVGGARTAVVSIDPDPLGIYIVGQQSSAPISIADADNQASLSVTKPTAYPTLPTIPTPAYPLEVQGRGEWLVHLNNQDYRSVAVQLAGDSVVGPQAVLDTDYWFGFNNLSIAGTANQYVTVVPLDPAANPLPAPPGPGSTTIPVSSLWVFGGNDIVVFENPTSIVNGIYTVTGWTAGTSTNNPTITISPALKEIQTGYGSTRVRRLAERVQGSGQVTTTVFGSDPDIYYFAFPVITNNTPQARRSINLTMLQNDDYRTLSPTSGTVTLADDAVTTGLRFNSNAGKPSTNGIIDVVLSNPFPTAVNVPFTVISGGSAVLGTDYTISGVDTATGLGSIQVPANTTTAQIVVQPISNLDPATKSLSLQLLTTPDYLLAPTGTSGVNPSASLSIAPAPRTVGGLPVYLGITSGSVAEGTAGSLRIFLSNAAGVELASDPVNNVLANGAAVLISVSGTAVTGVDYQALATSVQMDAGTASKTIPIQTINNRTAIIDHTLAISLLPGAGYQLSTLATGTLTIQDTSPSISISQPITAPVEGGAGVNFTITASRTVDRLTLVGFTIGGTASANVDYTLIANGNGVINYPGLTGTTEIQLGSSTTTVTVLATSDTITDPGETIILTVVADTQALPNYKLGTPASTLTATTTIVEAPVASIATISIAATSSTATQAATPVPGIFKITANRTASPSNAAISVNLPVGGTAVPGTGFAYAPLPTNVILAELTTTVDAPAGASFLTATVVGGGATTIPKDAILRIGTGATEVTVASTTTVGATATVIPLNSPPLAAPVPTATSVGVCTAVVPVTPLSSTTSYNGQTVIVTLAPIIGANWSLATSPLKTTDTVTILSGYPRMSISPDIAPVEGGVNGTFTVTASQSVGTDVTIAYTVDSTSTATSGVDFTALLGTVVIPQGSNMATITVAALADNVAEVGETVDVTLIPDPAPVTAYHLTATTTASLTIIEPSTTPIATVSATATTPIATQSATPVPGLVTISATRVGNTNAALTVSLPVGGTAVPGLAYTALPANIVLAELVTTVDAPAGAAFLTAQVVGGGTATIPSNGVLRIGSGSTVTVASATTVGATGTVIPLLSVLSAPVASATSIGVCSATAAITPTSSSINYDGQTVVITLADGANWSAATAPSNTATVTIRSGYPRLSIAAGIAPVEGGVNGTFTVTASQTVAADVTVAYTVAGTATSGVDFTALQGSVTIPKGSNTATITVVALADSVTDPGETVIVTLIPDPTLVTTYHLTSTDRDTLIIAEPSATSIATVAAVATTALATQAPTPVPGQITISATRSGTTNSALTVGLPIGGTALPGTAYTALQSNVILAELVTTIDTPVGAGFITAQVVGGVSTTIPAGGILRIGTGPTATLVTVAATITVGATGTTIPLQNILAAPVLATTSVGVCTAVVPVTPVPSATNYDGQTIAITLANGANWTADTTPATVTIRSGYAKISVAAGTAPVEGGVDGTFTVTSSQTATADIVVSYAVSGTATSGVDFTALGGKVTISSGSSTASIPVHAISDAADPNETVVVTLSPDPATDLTKIAYHLASTSTSASVIIVEPPAASLATISVQAVEPLAIQTETPVPGWIAVVAERRGSTSNAKITANLAISGTASPGVAYTALPSTVEFAELVTTVDAAAGIGFLTAKVVGGTDVRLFAGDWLRVGSAFTVVTVASDVTVTAAATVIPLRATLGAAVLTGTSIGVMTSYLAVVPIYGTIDYSGRTVIATVVAPAGANWVAAAPPDNSATVTIASSATPPGEIGKPAPVAGSTKSSGKCGLGGGLAVVGLAGMLLLAWRRRR